MDTEDPTQLVERQSRCHCGLNTFRVHFRISDIPIRNYLCHCNTCRHVTGKMAFSYVPIVGVPLVGSVNPRPIDPETKEVRGYRTSPTTVRFFCHNCSAHLLVLSDNTTWAVSGGSVYNLYGIAQLRSHIWINDTMDGGLANLIRNVDKYRIPRFGHGPDSQELPLSWRSKHLPSKAEARSQDKLDAYCHCGAVRFYITRPNQLSAIPRAPYPDLLFPTVQTRLATMRNPKDEKWWLVPSMRPEGGGGQLVQNEPQGNKENEEKTPGTQTRYLAGHCVCDYCRLGGGFEVQSWAFISRANVFEVGSEEPIELVHEPDRPKGLKSYSSSPGRYREFCVTCGATAFWWNAGMPDVIDVSIGLLDQQKDGARAEEWLKWHKERLSFAESAKKTGYIQGLMDGLASYPDPEGHEN